MIYITLSQYIFTIYFILNNYILSIIIQKLSKKFLQERSIHYVEKNMKI